MTRPTKMSFRSFDRAKLAFGNLIDVRAGAIGATILGSVVWAINMLATTPPDLLGSTTAALKQGAYTFFVGGFLLRLMTWMALRPGNPLFVIFNATLVPGALGCGLTYFVHTLRGTPSPFLSTVPTILLSVLLNPVWVVYQRRKQPRT